MAKKNKTQVISVELFTLISMCEWIFSMQENKAFSRKYSKSLKDIRKNQIKKLRTYLNKVQPDMKAIYGKRKR